MTPGPGESPPPAAGWAEVRLVAVVLVAPVVATGLPARADPLVAAELWQLANAAAWVALVGYLVRRSGRPPAAFGLARPDWLTDGCTALLLVPVSWWSAGWVADLWLAAGLPAGDLGLGHPLPTRGWHWPLLAAGYLASGFAEELVYRGFLQTELTRLTGSAVSGWLTAAALFAAAHAYHGPQGLVVCGANGLVFGAAFALTGRVWGVAAGHTGYGLLLYAAAA